MPAVDDRQVNGPSEMDMSYPSVGVPWPAFERHWVPLHSVSVLSVPSVTDRCGDSVKQSVEVMEDGPKLSSISQLMFPEGERNSVPVGV